MNLIVYCKGCEKPIRFSARASDRARLADKLGENVELHCKNCGQKSHYHVNRVYAVHNRVALIGSLFVLIFGTLSTLIIFGPYIFGRGNASSIKVAIGAITIPALIFLAMSRSQDERIRLFNSYRL